MYLLATGCGSPQGDTISGVPAEQGFIPRGSDEIDTMLCLRRSIEAAESLLADPEVSSEDKEQLREAATAARVSLVRYDELRSQGGTYTVVMGGLRTACAGLLADDAVGGLANDVLLIPVALAAIATQIVVNSPATEDELSRAWTHTGQRIDALGRTVQDVISHMTAVGNVADTGIMGEVVALLGSMGLASNPKTICFALETLLTSADKIPDKKEKNQRKRRIEATQKAKGCRPSRHSR